MKKIVSLVSLLAVLTMFVGCTTKKEVVIPNITVTTVVHPSDWLYDNTSKTYYVNIDMPEIDGQVNASGGILVSISFGNGLYELIPDIYNGYSFYVTHSVGNLTIEAEDQFNTAHAPTGDMVAKIVIVPSY